jgi:serine/threonine protein kinase
VTDEELECSLDVDGSYRIVRVLADGASGRTELVTRGIGDLLVRKFIPAELANPETWEAAREISCPQMPAIRLAYRLPDAFVVVYDYVEGFSVAQMVRDKGRLEPREAMPIVVDVCAAAVELHRRGIIHRDITPGNVIVNTQGAHLIDLGIARRYDQGAHHDTTRLGTFGFAAPEQFGFAQTDVRSDVYSIGALLAFMLTGVLPSAPEFESALEEISPALRRIVGRACAFEPSARYASARELAQAVRAVVPASPALSVALRAPRPTLAALRSTHGGRRLAAVSFVTVAALLALLFVVTGVTLLMRPASYLTAISALTAFAIAVWAFDLCGLQLCLVVAHAHPYCDKRDRLRTYLRRCRRDTGLLIVCVFVLVVVGAVLEATAGA